MTNENLDRPEGEYPLSSLIDPMMAEHLEGKSLNEHSIEDIYSFFECCDAITYVFLTRGDYCLDDIEVGPHVLWALELVSCLGQGNIFDRPIGKRDRVVDHPKDVLEQIQHQVEIRVQEMRRRPGFSFVLGWAVGDEAEPHIAHSDDKSEEALKDLFDSVLHEVHSYAQIQ